MAVQVEGLNGNGYLINNSIILNILETGNTSGHFGFKIEIYKGSSLVQTIVTSAINKRLRLDISSQIKSLFSLPSQYDSNSNAGLFRIHIFSGFITPLGFVYYDFSGSYNVTKSFIRGGIRGNGRNLTLPVGAVLNPDRNVYTPYFPGYPNEVSSIINDNGNLWIVKQNINPLAPNVIKRREKGCNSTYVKFMNSLGGYSFWLFEGNTYEEKNTNSGIINNLSIIDLGNEVQEELELYSKVPRNFISIMKDLIISPEIYIYSLTEQGETWSRYYSGSNTIEINPVKTSQEVKIKLKPFTNYNPQVIWQ